MQTEWKYFKQRFWLVEYIARIEISHKFTIHSNSHQHFEHLGYKVESTTELRYTILYSEKTKNPIALYILFVVDRKLQKGKKMSVEYKAEINWMKIHIFEALAHRFAVRMSGIYYQFLLSFFYFFSFFFLNNENVIQNLYWSNSSDANSVFLRFFFSLFPYVLVDFLFHTQSNHENFFSLSSFSIFNRQRRRFWLRPRTTSMSMSTTYYSFYFLIHE